ncbi:hypothetical protein OUZ56_032632 [Daphnia magna]|uniref:Uncharacterized protein n=1 Tax=Daphnia magna TaxID=35525 RepID=A0ABR0B9G4_9CRUS|nr:hypothetical protein OUZ56_032632 [Daphnia magna]
MRFRHASLYVNGAKVAECSGSTIDIESGDEAQIGDDGFLGYSDGAITSTVSLETVRPVGGTGKKLMEEYMLNTTDVSLIGNSIEGKAFSWSSMRVTKASTKSEAKTARSPAAIPSEVDARTSGEEGGANRLLPPSFVAGDTIPVLFCAFEWARRGGRTRVCTRVRNGEEVARGPSRAFFANEQEALSLSREAITYLYEHQQSWQDELSPTVKNLGQADIIATLVRLSEEDDPSGFIRLSPGLRWICTRTMAGLLVNSPMGKSSLGSDSEPDSKTTGSDKKSEGESL